jgi:hypothetical protein
MDESALLSKAADKLAGKGQDPIPGIITLSDLKVAWRPDDSGVCAEEVIPLNLIESML